MIDPSLVDVTKAIVILLNFYMWNKLLSLVPGRPKYTETVFKSTIAKITTENSEKKVIAAMGTLVEILIWGE